MDDPCFDKYAPCLYSVEIIKVKDFYGALSDFCTGSNKTRRAKLKVLAPTVFPWVIEPDKGILILVPSSNATSFT